jgi:hypothetical protein
VYLRGGRAPVYGLSDVDLAVVVAPDPAHPGRARQRVRRRRALLARWAPGLVETILDSPYVLERDDLAGSVPSQVHGLEGGNGDRSALYFGEREQGDLIRLAENPGLYGLASDWRLVTGRGRPLREQARDAQHRRLAAWLGLQATWRWYLQACPEPTGPRWADLCVKAVADPARAWLWLSCGERTDGRRGTLERALALIPEEEEALRAALALERSLGRAAPTASHEEFAAYFVRLTLRVGDLMAAEVAEAGTTAVSLVWGGADELVLAPDAAFRLAALVDDTSEVELLPLADWRALARASLRVDGTPVPPLLDETLAPVPLDPGRLADLTAATGAGDDGPYPALRAGDLLVLASVRWPRTQLRAVASPLTDPASFALLDGSGTAHYPRVAGWAARDVARRAVAEHAAWLQAPIEPSRLGEELAMAVSAIRAALFLESITEGEPELTPTVAGTLRRLRDHPGGDVAVIDEAEESYRRYRLEGIPLGAPTVMGLRRLVARLPSYRRGAASPAAELPA